MAGQKAIVIRGSKKAEFVTDRAIPTLRPGYLLVKVAAVALNPTDWKHIDYADAIAKPGCLAGCDYAGTVEKLGSGYTKEWKLGDRIAGFAHGGNAVQLEDGAFAEHIVVKADVQIKIPDHLSFEKAATLGVGTITVGQGLCQKLGLAYPTTKTPRKETVLIYGGSTGMSHIRRHSRVSDG